MHTQFKIHNTQNVGSPVFLVMNVCSAGSCRTKKYEQCFKFFEQLQQSRVVLQGGMRHFEQLQQSRVVMQGGMQTKFKLSNFNNKD